MNNSRVPSGEPQYKPRCDQKPPKTKIGRERPNKQTEEHGETPPQRKGKKQGKEPAEKRNRGREHRRTRTGKAGKPKENHKGSRKNFLVHYLKKKIAKQEELKGEEVIGRGDLGVNPKPRRVIHGDP